MRAVRWLLIVVPVALLTVPAIYPVPGWLVRQHLGIPRGAVAAELSIALIAGNKETLARMRSRLKQVRYLPHSLRHLQECWQSLTVS